MTVQALAFGLMLAWLLGQAYYPLVLLRSTQPEPAPEPAPPADPRRDPDWCHSHGKHKSEEEQ